MEKRWGKYDKVVDTGCTPKLQDSVYRVVDQGLESMGREVRVHRISIGGDKRVY